MQVSQEIKII